MDIKDKLLEWLRGEREWDQRDMARECLAEIERLETFWINWAPFPVHIRTRD